MASAWPPASIKISRKSSARNTPSSPRIWRQEFKADISAMCRMRRNLRAIDEGLEQKLKAQDKAAIVAWLKKIDAEQYARNARVLGKAFTGVDWAIKGADLINAAIEGFSTGSWKAFRNQLEALGLSIGAGYTLSAIAAFSRRRWCRRRWAFCIRLSVWLGYQLYRCGSCRRTGKIHPRDVTSSWQKRGMPLFYGYERALNNALARLMLILS